MSGEIEVKRSANRAAFPGVAAIVDEFRAVFGAEVKVLSGIELSTGKSFGNTAAPHSGCSGCDGNRECDHPDRATQFCGFRERDEKTYLASRWVKAGGKRLYGGER